MRKVKEVLRLHFESHMWIRRIAASCSLSRSAVSDMIARAIAAKVSWPPPGELGDSELEALLHPQPLGRRAKPDSVKMDMPYIQRELSRKRVTLQLLWTEYIAQNPGGYHPGLSRDSCALPPRRACSMLEQSAPMGQPTRLSSHALRSRPTWRFRASRRHADLQGCCCFSRSDSRVVHLMSGLLQFVWQGWTAPATPLGLASPHHQPRVLHTQASPNAAGAAAPILQTIGNQRTRS